MILWTPSRETGASPGVWAVGRGVQGVVSMQGLQTKVSGLPPALAECLEKSSTKSLPHFPGMVPLALGEGEVLNVGRELESGCFASSPKKRSEGQLACPFLCPPAPSLPLLHPDTGLPSSALEEWILGSPSTSKRLFHTTDVNIKLLICPGAVKLSSAKGERNPSRCSFYLLLLIAALSAHPASFQGAGVTQWLQQAKPVVAQRAQCHVSPRGQVHPTGTSRH